MDSTAARCHEEMSIRHMAGFFFSIHSVTVCLGKLLGEIYDGQQVWLGNPPLNTACMTSVVYFFGSILQAF